MNAIFTRNDEQQKLAEQSREEHAQARKMKVEEINTEIDLIDHFSYAERYHQKYLIRSGSELRTFLESTYPDIKALADSTVATRINNLLGSRSALKSERIQKEISQYGLPENLEAQLRSGK